MSDPVRVPPSSMSTFRRALVALALVLAGASCNPPPSGPERLADARAAAADLRLDFARAADASNRAVMTDTESLSRASAAEAEQAKKTVLRDADALEPLLRGLAYSEEVEKLAELRKSFEAYQAVDRTLLELAVENTNHKAQKLSFGPVREAADAFRAALDKVSRAAPAKSSCQVASLAASAVVAVREIQVLHAPHIAESDDAVMSRMETDMDALFTSARTALSSLASAADPASRPELAAATEALDRFHGLHVEIIALSRRNTNVRSLTLALGQERTLASACESSLATLSDELSKRSFARTR